MTCGLKCFKVYFVSLAKVGLDGRAAESEIFLTFLSCMTTSFRKILLILGEESFLYVSNN